MQPILRENKLVQDVRRHSHVTFFCKLAELLVEESEDVMATQYMPCIEETIAFKQVSTDRITTIE